jgi:hypothetical protein
MMVVGFVFLWARVGQVHLKMTGNVFHVMALGEQSVDITNIGIHRGLTPITGCLYWIIVAIWGVFSS